MDRIDFEEIALKGVDPSLGPKIIQWPSKDKDSEAKEEDRIVVCLTLSPQA